MIALYSSSQGWCVVSSVSVYKFLIREAQNTLTLFSKWMSQQGPPGLQGFKGEKVSYFFLFLTVQVTVCSHCEGFF